MPLFRCLLALGRREGTTPNQLRTLFHVSLPGRVLSAHFPGNVSFGPHRLILNKSGTSVHIWRRKREFGIGTNSMDFPSFRTPLMGVVNIVLKRGGRVDLELERQRYRGSSRRLDV